MPRLLAGPRHARPIALGIDVRNRDFSATALITLIERLTPDPALALEVLFVDCAPAILVRRYSETRRRHPMAPAEDPATGIAREIDLLAPVRVRADVLIDTTDLPPHDLRAEIARWFATGTGQRMAVSVQSFSYKRGLPRGIDMVFDCQFLSNPYWTPELRPLDGRDPRVAAHVAADPRFAPFFDRLGDLIGLLLPAHVAEGKSHLAIGLGCTGGQHRSVTVAEKLGASLAQAGWDVSIRHRELERQPPAPAAAG